MTPQLPMDLDVERGLTRLEAAEFLTVAGFPIARTTLAKLASIGGGPRFKKFGSRPIYWPKDLLQWAQDRTTKPRTSTSDVGGGHD